MPTPENRGPMAVEIMRMIENDPALYKVFTEVTAQTIIASIGPPQEAALRVLGTLEGVFSLGMMVREELEKIEKETQKEGQNENNKFNAAV